MKRKKIIKLGSREKEILYQVGTGALLISSVVAPGMPLAVKKISKDYRSLKRVILRLQAKGLISLGGEKVKLSSKGLMLKSELEKEHMLSLISIEKPKEWDGNWHLISYDIPKIYNKSRDLLRGNLERLGFVKVQDSLWVFPYECRDEIALLANEINVADNVIYMTTEYLPRETELKKYFGLETEE